MYRSVVEWTKQIGEQAKGGKGREALWLYKRMREEGIIPDEHTFIAALKACIAIADLDAGKELHSHVDASGKTNLFVANTLVHMYAKCGSIHHARLVFDHMTHRDPVSWNTIITAYAQQNHGDLALALYSRMQNQGFPPDARTFSAVLKACSSLAASQQDSTQNWLQQGRAIHSEAVKLGLASDPFVACTLVDMYAKFGSIDDARAVFEKMTCRDTVSWNAIIMGYAQMEMGAPALELYARMRNEGFTPAYRTFVATLTACASLAAQAEGRGACDELLKASYLQQGRAIHAEVAERGFESDIFVANSLVDMYAKCGSIEDARQVFERTKCRNIVSWNTMILGYAQMGMGDLALEMYKRMQNEGFAPDARTFVAALNACAGLATQEDSVGVDGKLLKTRFLQQGRAIHSDIEKSGFDSNIFVASTLVDMYAKCGSIEDAREIFGRMRHRSVVSWNTMMIGYVQMEMGIAALELYADMQNEGFSPDAHTFVAVLKACASLAAQGGKGPDVENLKASYLEQGRAIHAEAARRGFDSNIFVVSTLVDMYAKCGSIENALQVFERTRHRDVVPWSAMMIGYVQMERGDLALELYARMQIEGFTPDTRIFVAALKACASLAAQEEGKGTDGGPLKTSYLKQGRAIHAEVAKRGLESDVYVASTLVDLYAKCGSIKDARQVFERIKHRDVVSWNAMITGYAQMEMGDLALKLYDRMQHEGFTPNARTFVAALHACGSLASLETGKEIHSQIHEVGLQDEPFIANCLVDMYSKCGSMWDAQQIFDSLLVRTSVAWNALIAGYSGQGDSECLFDLYRRMQQEGIQPDSITFVSLLNACSHNGLVDKGQMYFQAMCLEYGIFPSCKHYTCMIDLLGRTGQLDEAATMVMKMPMKPDTVTWLAILGACQKWNNAETGRNSFECAVTLDEKSAAAYVLMANICVSCQMWKMNALIEEMKMKAQLWKKPGLCRWTDSSGMVHTFLMGDRSHSQSNEIYEKLKDLSINAREEGYMSDLDVVSSHTPDEIEDVLCGHTEKLAVACALINTPPGTTIRVVKNLQICVNCHKAIALISKIEQRTIICRDLSRFHILKGGKCSCHNFC